ncbi:MAG: DNA polymerase III subunit delta [Lachnospiraceae bacterium]
MKSLNEDLKSENFKQVYLLYGEEDYLKKQYRYKLTKALGAADDTMNYSYYEGKNIPVGEVIDLAETLPFLADKRLIVIEDSGFFKSAANELADYIKELSGVTHFVFVEHEVDKRNRLYKAVKDKGRAVELGQQNETTLVRWIAGSIKKEQKQITESTIHYFLSKVGIDMENIQQELEKLFCYTMNKSQIEREDVDAICISQITNQIFAMVDAVAEKKQKKALDYYYDLLALKEPPMRILYLLSRQFKILLNVKDLTQHGYGNKEIASKAGVPPFAVSKYLQQAGAFKGNELQAILEYSADSEERVKTGRLNDVLAVEIFIMKYSTAN